MLFPLILRKKVLVMMNAVWYWTRSSLFRSLELYRVKNTVIQVFQIGWLNEGAMTNPALERSSDVMGQR